MCIRDRLVANRGLLQAAGSWSVDACCAVPGNDCSQYGGAVCFDRASSSDWLFGLWPGPPQRFEPIGNDTYQYVNAHSWPAWGDGGGDLSIGIDSGAPGGSAGACNQGHSYRGTRGEICGGCGWCDQNWGATDVEVWYPR